MICAYPYCLLELASFSLYTILLLLSEHNCMLYDSITVIDLFQMTTCIHSINSRIFIATPHVSFCQLSVLVATFAPAPSGCILHHLLTSLHPRSIYRQICPKFGVNSRRWWNSDTFDASNTKFRYPTNIRNQRNKTEGAILNQSVIKREVSGCPL